jgi:hypothetical protein
MLILQAATRAPESRTGSGRLRLVRSLITLTAVISVVVLAFPTVAHAGTAELSRKIYLIHPAPGDGSVGMQRNISLDAGWYRWTVGLKPDKSGGRWLVPAVRDIYLTRGNYGWYCAIRDTASSPGRAYQMYCSLNLNAGPGARLDHSGGIGGTTGWHIMRSQLETR